MKSINGVYQHIALDIGRDDTEKVSFDQHLLGCMCLCNSIKIGDNYRPLSRLIREAVNHFDVSALYWNSLTFNERGLVMSAYIDHVRSVAEDETPLSLALSLKRRIKDVSLLNEFVKRAKK